ncbi:acyl carrier protein [Actinopolyspora sp. H202]|uniref:acyl carrier protein n=1 Tax=Actinopolyspora sp. H202 TaxID=1500456 RepID=UPI003EE76BFF
MIDTWGYELNDIIDSVFLLFSCLCRPLFVRRIRQSSSVLLFIILVGVLGAPPRAPDPIRSGKHDKKGLDTMALSASHVHDALELDLETLRTLSIDERIDSIEDFLCHELVRALDMPPDYRCDPRRPLHAQGVGSMTALRLKKLLESVLGIEIETVKILCAQSLAELAALCALRIEDPTLSGKGCLPDGESIPPFFGVQR